MNEEPFRLFDGVIETAVGWKRSATASAMRQHAIDVRNSQRFCIDNGLVTNVLELADIKNLKRWSNLARLPYSRTWIEFDLHHKLRVAQQRGTLRQQFDPEQVAERMGLLFKTLDEETGMWCVTIFVSIKKRIQEEIGTHESALPQELVYFYAPEGPAVELAQLPKQWLRPALPKHAQHISLGVIDAEHVEEAPTTKQWREKVDWVAIPEFENRIQTAWEGTWAAIRKLDRASNESWNKKAGARLVEDAGLLRFCVVLLALLNAAPNVKEYVAAPSGQRFRGGKLIPYLSHNNLILHLPKGGVRALTRRLNVNSDARRKHRAHMVRGHFRQIDRGNPTIVRCSHEPTLVENGLGVCLKCERLIRWVPEHQRGDASIGWVNHDYHLEAA